MLSHGGQAPPESCCRRFPPPASSSSSSARAPPVATAPLATAPQPPVGPGRGRVGRGQVAAEGPALSPRPTPQQLRPEVRSAHPCSPRCHPRSGAGFAPGAAEAAAARLPGCQHNTGFTGGPTTEQAAYTATSTASLTATHGSSRQPRDSRGSIPTTILTAAAGSPTTA